MKWFSILLLLVSFSAALLTPRDTLSQKLSTVPVDLQIPVAPMPVKANGKMHLLYELHVTNFKAPNLEITRLEVLNDSSNSILASYDDRVKVGQVLALLGNSGNSDSPHLHFHICDGNSPLGAEGMPYVLDYFEMQGVLPSKKLLVEGGWRQQGGPAVDKRRQEIPIENAIVRFP